MKSLMTDHDVLLSFPPDSTVRVQSGEIIEVPLKLHQQRVLILQDLNLKLSSM